MGNIREDPHGTPMKFLIDLALSPKTVKVLDKEIVPYAQKNGLVVLTADLDFGDILASTRTNKHSVIIFRLKTPSPEHVNSLLLETLPRIQESLDTGAIVVIEDSRIRIRVLPVV